MSSVHTLPLDNLKFKNVQSSENYSLRFSIYEKSNIFVLAEKEKRSARIRRER